MLTEAISQLRVQEVEVNSLRESLFQQRRFAHLTASEQEHSLVQTVLNIEYSMVHNKQNFRNVIADFSGISATVLQK